MGESRTYGTPLTSVLGRFEKALNNQVQVHMDIREMVTQMQTTLVQSHDDISKGAISGSQVGSPTDTFLNGVKNGMTFDNNIGAPKCTTFDDILKIASSDGEVINAAQVLYGFDELAFMTSQLVSILDSEPAMLEALQAKGFGRDQLNVIRDTPTRVEATLNVMTVGYSALTVMAEYLTGAVDMMTEIHAVAKRNRGVFNESDAMTVIHALGFDTTLSQSVRNNMGGANGNSYYQSNEEMINERRAQASNEARLYFESLGLNSIVRMSQDQRAQYNWIMNESWKDPNAYQDKPVNNDIYKYNNGNGSIYNEAHNVPTTPVNKVEALREAVRRAGGYIEESNSRSMDGGIPIKDPNAYNPYEPSYAPKRGNSNVGRWTLENGFQQPNQNGQVYNPNGNYNPNQGGGGSPWIDDNDVYIDGYGNVIQVSTGFDVTEEYHAQRANRQPAPNYNQNGNYNANGNYNPGSTIQEMAAKRYNNYNVGNDNTPNPEHIPYYRRQGYNANGGGNGNGNMNPSNNYNANNNYNPNGNYNANNNYSPNGNYNANNNYNPNRNNNQQTTSYQKYLRPANYQDNNYNQYNDGYGGNGGNGRYSRPSAGYASEGNMIKI